MAAQIPTESDQQRMTQTIHDVSATNGSLSLAGTFHNLTIGTNLPATFEKRIKSCREALLVTDPDLDRKSLIAAKGKRAPGTCEWIEEDPNFKSWLARKFPVLRIYGGPGKGKTMLSLFLTEKLETICQKEGNHLLFFYCRFQDDKFNDPRNVLRNMVYQLLEFSQHGCQQVEHVLKYFESPKRTNDLLLNFEGLWETLETLLTQPGLPTIWCIVDGIDECQASERLEGRLYEFCYRYRRQNSESKFQVLILGRYNDGYDVSHVIRLDVDETGPDRGDVDTFATSKLEPLDQSLVLDPDTDDFDASRIIRLDKDHRKRIKSDVECFIISSLKPLENIPEFSQIRDDIIEILIEKAEGTFLWVSFVVAELRGKRNCTEIMDTVKAFPKGLSQTFSRMLSGIDARYHQASASILKWTVFAKRPLTINELAVAIADTVRGGSSEAKTSFTADIVQLLSPLLQIQGDAVFFVHQSAKEYFLESEQDPTSRLDGYRFLSDQCHGVIAHRCLQVIQEAYKHQTPDYLSQCPLFDYSKRYWAYHTRLSATCPDDITRLFFEDLVLQKKVMILDGHDSLPPSAISIIPSLHEASKLGTVRLLESLHRHANRYWKKNINLRVRALRPLARAILCGDECTIKFLLDHGADCQSSMKEGFVIAARLGQPGTIRLLLEHGFTFRYTVIEQAQIRFWSAYVNVLNGHVLNSYPSYILSCALRSVPRLRIWSKRDQTFDYHPETWYDSPRFSDTTILHYTIGPDVRSICRMPDTVARSKDDRKAVVQVVLDHGVNLEATAGRERRTAIFETLSEDRLDLLKLLLDHGANIEAKDYVGSTVLYEAVSMNRLPVVEYLLKRDADIETTDCIKETPLICAAENGNADIVRCLLTHGANIEAKDRLGETALMKTILRGHGESMECLLSHGADANEVAHSNRSHGSERVLNFLLPNGAAVDRKDTLGATPLICALVRWREPDDYLPGLYLDLPGNWRFWIRDEYPIETIVESLLDHGADPKLCGRVYLYEPIYKGTPGFSNIHEGLEKDFAWMVLDAPPILCAASIGLDWAIALLIQRGADCNATATEWHLPKRRRDHLMPPLTKGLQDLYLQNKGYQFENKDLYQVAGKPLPKHARTRQAGSALVYASLACRLSTVRLLLSLGADTSIEDGFGMTALAWARKKGLEAGTEARRKAFDEIAGVLEAHDERRT